MTALAIPEQLQALVGTRVRIALGDGRVSSWIGRVSFIRVIRGEIKAEICGEQRRLEVSVAQVVSVAGEVRIRR